ncbi:3-phosphoshikimate 1-carboxyvinyltransferase [Fibrobacter sp. UBA3629]|uniref:3-phosphoshikimate 1-carboxyvinyltransferase n=1 Tax=Fibrobacter sp. UBA3629 TaxID=1946530 RepID=UPI0025C0D6DE|nr:3-phosphoshikimate 1-carboxyvinyltransferase [Fibrobacter sp. UBA3629]
MEDFQFRPSYKLLPPSKSFSGVVRVPGSKSITNRAFLIAALACGTTRLHNLLRSDDTRYMGEALQKLGVKIEFSEDFSEATVYGNGGPIDAPADASGEKKAELYLGNAGTAMRSLCAALTLGSGTFCLSGEERMSERPIRDLVDALGTLGAEIRYVETEGYPPVTIRAHGLEGGEVSVRGNISSQYLTALLICAPYCKSHLKIRVEGELISEPYVAMTLSVMRRFGLNVEWPAGYPYEFDVPHGVFSSPGDFFVEGDASSASYSLAAAAISGGHVKVLGVGRNSIQGDVAFAEVLRDMGADIRYGSENGEDFIECVGPKGKLKSLGDYSAIEIPDAAMTLAVLALFADAPTTIRGIASWRVKETDRIAAMAAELRKVGAEVRESNDSITITPPETLQPVTIETYNDHRMAMCFSLVSLGGVPVKIMDPACVNKTYPQYFEDFEKFAK